MKAAGSDQHGRHPDAVVIEQIGSATAVVNGRTVDTFVLHDYYGFATHPEVCKAAAESYSRYGLSLCAVRPQGGVCPEHHQLETELAGFLGKEDAVIFASGSQATLAALETLVHAAASESISSESVLVCHDDGVHASTVAPARGAKVLLRDFSHNYLWALRKSLISRKIEQRIIVIYGVYSMTADVAPLEKILDVATEENATVLMDDAHGIGVVGDHLGGVADIYGVTKHPRLVTTGSFSKAFGGTGGFVAGSRELCHRMRRMASAYLHSQSLAPGMVNGLLVSLRLLREDGSQLQERLKRNIGSARYALKSIGVPIQGASALPCISIMVGDDEMARKLAVDMANEGVLVAPLTWPSVRENQARLRITLTALHTREQIAHLAECLVRSAARCGFRLLPRP